MAYYKFNKSFWLVSVYNHFLETECFSFVLVVDVKTEPEVKG